MPNTNPNFRLASRSASATCYHAAALTSSSFTIIDPVPIELKKQSLLLFIHYHSQSKRCYKAIAIVISNGLNLLLPIENDPSHHKPSLANQHLGQHSGVAAALPSNHGKDLNPKRTGFCGRITALR